jgi:hypothetical protein
MPRTATNGDATISTAKSVPTTDRMDTPIISLTLSESLVDRKPFPMGPALTLMHLQYDVRYPHFEQVLSAS